ncbi:NUDIX domain-containing protein [Novosphingobium sp. BL-8H]|uniref:NUDIX hydrolase n=1 Tax=Novosphingobium sp. BL-8H TaxID=3127640 RepID=UPI003757148B
MTESEAAFLTGYDPAAYDRPSIAVDLVLMSVIDGAPAALLVRRDEHPFAGTWALPGGFVRMDEALDDAARRVLEEKAHMAQAAGAYMEQLYTFGAVSRDPRTRVIAIAYFALLPAGRFAAALKADPGLSLARLRLDAQGSAVADCEDGALPLAFDHSEILGLAIRRLRGKIDWSPIAFALLPERFTLRALQDVHEAILGTPLNKPAFRRRMLDRGWLEATGERETGSSFRPAELFRFRPFPTVTG